MPKNANIKRFYTKNIKKCDTLQKVFSRFIKNRIRRVTMAEKKVLEII